MLFVIASINQLFFPSNDPSLSLLATFATYVVTLIMRPFGGAFFGNFGDKHGRKNAMIITITGFSIVTFLHRFIANLAICRNFGTNFIDNNEILH